MHLSRQLTVDGVQEEVYEKTKRYVIKLGYTVVDDREYYLLLSKKNVEGMNGEVYELWLSVAITGMSMVTVFMDYQLRKPGSSSEDGVPTQNLIRDIDKEYHMLWRFLSRHL
ncbi:MAG: hypothetical protein M1357_00970 [Candidatus Marsarchaeota archaeon]|nr:hypothetical protein [Candidatus Marsarchaeota archaeon]